MTLVITLQVCPTVHVQQNPTVCGQQWNELLAIGGDGVPGPLVVVQRREPLCSDGGTRLEVDSQAFRQLIPVFPARRGK
jgi:hypothetical protein